MKLHNIANNEDKANWLVNIIIDVNFESIPLLLHGLIDMCGARSYQKSH